MPIIFFQSQFLISFHLMITSDMPGILTVGYNIIGPFDLIFRIILSLILMSEHKLKINSQIPCL